MQRDAVVVFSNGCDGVGPAFSEYCKGRNLEVLLATSQPRTQFYFELSSQLSALLRITETDGSARMVPMEELRGVWFRGLPELPIGLDEEDAVYAATEFNACLVACLRSVKVPCFEYPSPETPFDSILNIPQIHAWCHRQGIPVSSGADDSHLLPIPIKASILECDLGTASRSPRAADPEPRADSIYYVRFGNRRQLLAQDGIHPEQTLVRALDTGDRIASQFSANSAAIVELRAGPDEAIVLEEIFPGVPGPMILRDPAWYFDAVLEALGV